MKRWVYSCKLKFVDVLAHFNYVSEVSGLSSIEAIVVGSVRNYSARNDREEPTNGEFLGWETVNENNNNSWTVVIIQFRTYWINVKPMPTWNSDKIWLIYRRRVWCQRHYTEMRPIILVKGSPNRLKISLYFGLWTKFILFAKNRNRLPLYSMKCKPEESRNPGIDASQNHRSLKNCNYVDAKKFHAEIVSSYMPTKKVFTLSVGLQSVDNTTHKKLLIYCAVQQDNCYQLCAFFLGY